MNIEGFFQDFFLKKTFIYFIWLRQTILFTLGEGWEDTYIQNLCGILGMCGMLRQRGIAFHTFRLRNDPKRAQIVWYDLNMNTGVKFLEFVECVECCVSTV